MLPSQLGAGATMLLPSLLDAGVAKSTECYYFWVLVLPRQFGDGVTKLIWCAAVVTKPSGAGVSESFG